MAMTAETKRYAEQLVRELLAVIEPDSQIPGDSGLELRPGLKDTPKRVVKSFLELYAGYDQKPEEILTRQFPPEGYSYDEMILVKNIDLHSMCEHHMLPFIGRAHVAYIPATNGHVVGLSKIARLVECFARRLQIQEKFTAQIANAMESVLSPKGVAVVLEARHLCMCARGVQKQNSSMVTSALRGVFKENAAARAEFMEAIK